MRLKLQTVFSLNIKLGWGGAVNLTQYYPHNFAIPRYHWTTTIYYLKLFCIWRARSYCCPAGLVDVLVPWPGLNLGWKHQILPQDHQGTLHISFKCRIECKIHISLSIKFKKKNGIWWFITSDVKRHSDFCFSSLSWITGSWRASCYVRRERPMGVKNYGHWPTVRGQRKYVHFNSGWELGWRVRD